VNSWNQVDLDISRNVQIGGTDTTAYFVVQNLFNAQPAYVPNGTIGQIYPTAEAGFNGYGVQSPMGRYLTVGIRASL
jgi:outer membrane receptor protein involved in Fe transport